MSKSMKRFVALLLCVLSVGAGYPEKRIRIVTPSPPGGVADIVARPIAAGLSEAWGQPVAVDNTPGAGGNVAADAVAQSPPDGYTLLIGSTGPNAANAGLYRRLPYDALNDFAPITLVATAYLMLVVHPSVPVESVGELIALGRARPGQLTYGSPGNGSIPHLAAELFSRMTGIRMTQVAYRAGSVQHIADLVTGRIDLLFSAAGRVLPHIASGRLKLLAITADTRDPEMPDVTTISEAAVPGFDVQSWYGLLASAGTPRAIIDRLHDEVVRILAAPETRADYAAAGLRPVTSTPAELSAYMRHEYAKWAKLIAAAGLRLD
jgi:tripartite-type tricarboxylate transporter receptor subunit TctC